MSTSDVDDLEPEHDGLEKPREMIVIGNLDVVQTPAVGEQHLALGDGLDQIGDAAAHRQGTAIFVEPIGPFHPAFGQDDHHAVAPDGAQHRFPGMVALAADRHHVAGDKAPEKPHQAAKTPWSAAESSR
jgi:hypothetical protein